MSVCKLFLGMISYSEGIVSNHESNYFSLKLRRPFCAYVTRVNFKMPDSHRGCKGRQCDFCVERILTILNVFLFSFQLSKLPLYCVVAVLYVNFGDFLEKGLISWVS